MMPNIDCKELAKKIRVVERAKTTFPISRWLPKYSLKDLQCDMIAGLTVALTVMPQGLAYAQVADLPPQYGLYSAFMGCFIYCIFGTSKDITLGPTAIMSYMTKVFADSPVHNNCTYAVILNLMCGAIQVLMGVLHLGFVVDFISLPVISGFTSAAAITIAFGQVKHLLGLKDIPNGFLREVYYTFKKIGNTNGWDLLLGSVCMVILFLLKLLKSYKWGDDGLQISTSQSVARKFLWLLATGRNAVVVISLTGPLTPGVPDFTVPNFILTDGNTTYSTAYIFNDIGIGFVVVPFIGLVEAIAIGKAFARQNNYRIDANQELIAIGTSNILGSFVSAYPVTGSFSRTAVNSQSGVRTPAGGIVTGSLVLLALAFLTPLFYYIPAAALAAVIISAVLQMVEYQIVIHIWKIKKLDILPWLVTLLLSFIIGIEYGILVGIGFSILMLMYPIARPAVAVHNGDIVVITLAQGLNFPAIEYTKTQVLDQAISDIPRSVILDFTYVSTLDFTTIHGFMELFQDFERHNILLVLVGLQNQVLKILQYAEIEHLRYCATVEEATKLILDESEPEQNPSQSLLAKSATGAYPIPPVIQS